MKIKIPYRIKEILINKLADYCLESSKNYEGLQGEIDFEEDCKKLINEFIDILNSEQEIYGNIIKIK